MAGSAWAAMAPTPALLAPARVMQGVGIALLVNACLRAILGSRPGRGAAMTYFGIASTVGGVFGLLSGGYLTEQHGWRAVFVAGAVIGGVIATMTGVTRLYSQRVGSPIDIVPSATSAGTVALRGLLWPLLFNFLIFFNYCVYVTLPLYTEHRFNASPETNARLLMVITVVHIIASVPAGRVIRRWGGYRSLLFGMSLSIAGTLAILLASSPLMLTLPLIVYGTGQLTGMNAGGDIVLHLGHHGTRSISYLRISSDLGLVFGPFVTGMLADHLGYSAPFIVLPAVMTVAAGIVFVQGRAMGWTEH